MTRIDRDLQREILNLLDKLRAAATDPGDIGYTLGKIDLVKAGDASHITEAYRDRLASAVALGDDER
jgi:hypothetical protein